MFSSHRRVITIICGVTMLALLLTGAGFSQTRLARANAAVGQKAIFKVVGNQLPVCLAAYTVDPNGNLLTFTSRYIGALQTIQFVPQVTPSISTTTLFATFDVGGGGPSTACAATPSAGSFLSDPAREPRIYETLSGGDTPIVNVKQLAGIVNVGVSICGNLSPTTTVGNAVLNGSSIVAGIDCSVFAPTTNVIAQISNTTAVVTFGFEDIDFTPSTGGTLATLLTTCTSPQFSTNVGYTITCTPTTGTGTLSGQTF
jgi:hypothetical protein